MTATGLHLTGTLPERWREAMAALEADLGYTVDEGGIPVACEKGEALSVESDGRAVRLTWAEPVQLYRALSLLPQPLAPCAIRETPRFETVGAMFDCSRNAVLRPESLRRFLRKMALMGLNLGMLYTEDTYEVPEQPFFGYKRGRYTFDELKELDGYADMLGIELCPCIQTLGHLEQALHWPGLNRLRENASVLLADLDETYAFLDQSIRAASAPYRSRRIHIGMDEAYGVGLGAHLNRWGYEDPRGVMGRHLKRVLDITDRYGLKPMMWSDMYFSLDGRGYYSRDLPSQTARQAVDPRVTLVYWDYYHSREEDYDAMLAKHACFGVPTVFAGGVWAWTGPAPAYTATMANTVPALTACMRAGVPMVFATVWGDNGAETDMTTALLGLQLYGEMAYTGVYDDGALRRRFRRCCGADAQAFLDMDLFNLAPGLQSNTASPVNACKFLLYQDPLIQLFEADTAGLTLSEHYRGLAGRFRRYEAENRESAYAPLLRFYTALGEALAGKCRWHELAAEAVRRGDRRLAGELAESMPAVIRDLETLRRVWRTLWESTNKPQGFEVIEVRLGGVTARMATAAEKMSAFARGETDDIPELTEPSLVFKRRSDGTMPYVNDMTEIATASRINW